MLAISQRWTARAVPKAQSALVPRLSSPSPILTHTLPLAIRLYTSNADEPLGESSTATVRRHLVGEPSGGLVRQYLVGWPSERKESKGSFHFSLVDDPDAWFLSRPDIGRIDDDVVLFHTENKQSLVLNRNALRDSCECDKCVDPHSGQKNFGTTEVPDEVLIQSCRRLEDASLEIVWGSDFLSSGGQHISVYSPSVIRTWFNKSREGLPVLPNLTIWDRKLFEASPSIATYDDWISGGPGFHKALAQLWNYGLLFIDGVPKSEQSVVTIASQIGHVMETFYGRTWDVRSKPQAENVAYTNTFLGLHQDLLYTKDPPRIQLLHCLENTCEGGDSIFSDSKRAANLMKVGPRELYQALLAKRIRYHYKKDGHYYEQMRRVLGDAADTVFWSPPFQSPNQPFNTTTSGSRDYATWLKAAKTFRKLLEDEQWLFEYKLKPGQCVIFDNLRVLHGRRRFDTTSGSRWLKGTYVSGDEWKSKTSTLAREITAASKEGIPQPSTQARKLNQLYGVWPPQEEAQFLEDDLTRKHYKDFNVHRL